MSCVWNVTEEDRLCRYCTRNAHCVLARKNGVLPSTQYLEVMNDLVGEDIRKKGHHTRLAHCRYMVMYQMSRDGFSQDCISRVVQRARCIVPYGKTMVADMLSVPLSYSWEAEIWHKYEETINSMKDENIRQASEVVAV